MLALIAFVLFLIVAIINFLHGDLLGGLAFTAAAAVSLHLVHPLAIPGRA
ncbi:MAG TPA: hypothetical protein VF506_18410 [Streptosporangiaceae bacterium]